MFTHLAADVLEFFGCWSAFAQQTDHGINHAAGVVVGGVGCVLQTGGGIDVGHFRLLLDRRESVDRPQLALQSGDVRRDIKAFPLQRRLIVGVLHVGDGLSDDAYFFCECIHVFIYV